ncbi:MAG: hypothetical protein QOK40_1176, partial [Miltoncostaeaceae bacterium]|nr:hypothetical protein [Miltoncostaeaceae bacterium]
APILPHLTARQLWGGLGTACKLAGVVHRSPHELRRRDISRLVLAGVDPVAGHAKGLDSGARSDSPDARRSRAHRGAALRRGVAVVITVDVYGHVREDFPAQTPFPDEVEDTGLD